MKIEANDKEVQDIFALGYFSIPRFQRPYSWELEEVESFWNDIIKENTPNYFIGSMVTFQKSRPYLGIVDGQQRLTTITLILSAVRNAFMSLGQENLAKGVHKYIEKANIDNENEFILASETSYPYLQDHIQSYHGRKIDCEVGNEEQKLKSAFELISSKIEEFVPELKNNQTSQSSLFTDHDLFPVQKLKDIRDKVLSLKLVFIQLDNEDDAYLIFETLNARGRDLTTADLVKNLILKNKKTKNRNLDQAKESWNSITRNFDNSSDYRALDNFLLHHWISKHNYTTEKKLFSQVKSHIDDNENTAEGILDELNTSAKIYKNIIDPSSSHWKNEQKDIATHLDTLNKFKVKQQYPAVLSILRSYKRGLISLKTTKQTLQKIVDFHYCFNAITSQRSSGSIASNYSVFAISLEASQNNDEAQKALHRLNLFLSSKKPDLEEFVVKFSDLAYSSRNPKYKSIVRYSLQRMIPTTNNGLPIDTSELTIEHLIPESYVKSGEDPCVIDNIGNLILLDQHTNASILKNLSPEQKLEKLKSIQYPSHLLPSDINGWNVEVITQRAHAMATEIYKTLRV